MTHAAPGPAAVVFDLDGILTDTEHLWDEIRRGLAAEDGRPWPAEATTAMMGMSTPEWSSYLVETVGLRGTPQDAARRTIDAMAQRYRAGVPLLPGAVDAVRRTAAVRPVGLASSSPRRLIDEVLAQVGLRDDFTATVSTEEVAAGKPAPDGYLRACELLSVDPRTAVAVEDSANGIRAAKAAGMGIVAIPPHFHPPAAQVLALADATLAGLAELTEDVLRTVAARR